jgi:hypothetical protein
MLPIPAFAVDSALASVDVLQQTLFYQSKVSLYHCGITGKTHGNDGIGGLTSEWAAL